MDTLVARYSRPMFSNEGYAKEQQEELEGVQEVPALSLKFAMPPVAQVCLYISSSSLPPFSPSPAHADHTSPPHGSAPQQTTTPTPTAPSRSRTERRRWPSDSRAVSSWRRTRGLRRGTGLRLRRSRRSSRSTAVCWAQWLVELLFVSLSPPLFSHFPSWPQTQP